MVPKYKSPLHTAGMKEAKQITENILNDPDDDAFDPEDEKEVDIGDEEDYSDTETEIASTVVMTKMDARARHFFTNIMNKATKTPEYEQVSKAKRPSREYVMYLDGKYSISPNIKSLKEKIQAHETYKFEVDKLALANDYGGFGTYKTSDDGKLVVMLWSKNPKLHDIVNNYKQWAPKKTPTPASTPAKKHGTPKKDPLKNPFNSAVQASKEKYVPPSQRKQQS